MKRKDILPLIFSVLTILCWTAAFFTCPFDLWVKFLGGGFIFGASFAVALNMEN